jgi:hypothetical protein
MNQDTNLEKGVPQEDGVVESQPEDHIERKPSENLGRRRLQTRQSQMSKSERIIPDLPAPMTIHTSMHFLDKFEELGSATTAVDETEPATPTSLGIPPPPKSPIPELLPLPAPARKPAPPPAGPPTPKWSRLHEIAFIINVCLAQFITLGALAQTVAPLSLIVQDLKVTHHGEMSWFTAAYSMTLGTFILPAGRYQCNVSAW